MEYVTKSGDTFDSVAYKVYGDARFVSELIDANREHLDTFIFSAGVRLKVPDISAQVSKSKLPPWKN